MRHARSFRKDHQRTIFFDPLFSCRQHMPQRSGPFVARDGDQSIDFGREPPTGDRKQLLLGEHGRKAKQARHIDRLEIAFVLDRNQHRLVGHMPLDLDLDAEQILHAPAVPPTPGRYHALEPMPSKRDCQHRCHHEHGAESIEQQVEQKTTQDRHGNSQKPNRPAIQLASSL